MQDYSPLFCPRKQGRIRQVQKCVHDFQKHADRIWYKKFRENGYQIRSGVIESACLHVVGQKCPQAAMR